MIFHYLYQDQKTRVSLNLLFAVFGQKYARCSKMLTVKRLQSKVKVSLYTCLTFSINFKNTRKQYMRCFVIKILIIINFITIFLYVLTLRSLNRSFKSDVFFFFFQRNMKGIEYELLNDLLEYIFC